MLVKTVGSEEGKCLSCRGGVSGLRRERLGGVASELMGGVPTWRWRKCESQACRRNPCRWSGRLSSFFLGTCVDRPLRYILLGVVSFGVGSLTSEMFGTLSPQGPLSRL